MSEFDVGDKVVCVDSRGRDVYITVGNVYTVININLYDELLTVQDNTGNNQEFFMDRFKLAEQPEQDCPYSIIEELSAQVENLEELVSEQAARIRELQYDSQAQQAECYRRLNDLLTSHRSFQKSTECRSNELTDTIKLLQLCYDLRYGN